MMKYANLFVFVLVFCSCRNNDKKSKDVFEGKSLEQIKSNADFFYKNDDYPKAIIFFTELIKLDSAEGKYYFNRGYSYSMLLNTEQAIKDYLKSIQLDYRKADAYKNIGINYSTINDSLAIYYLNKSLEILPENQKIKQLINECKSRLDKK